MSTVDLSHVLTQGRAVFNRFLQQTCVLNPAPQVSAGLGEVTEFTYVGGAQTPCNLVAGTKTPEKYADIAGSKALFTVVLPYGTVAGNGYHCDVYARGADPQVDPPRHKLRVIDVTDQDTTFGVATSLVCVERT